MNPSRREFLQGTAALAATAATAGLAHAAEAAAPRKQPNLVFFLGEGQRADAMSIAGHPLLKTPNHDRIGREGMLFRNAFCTNALCAPARTVAMTGMYSRSTGMLSNEGLNKPLPSDLPFLTDLLRAAGYKIAIAGKCMRRSALKTSTGTSTSATITQATRTRTRFSKRVMTGSLARTRSTRMSTPTISPPIARCSGLDLFRPISRSR